MIWVVAYLLVGALGAVFSSAVMGDCDDQFPVALFLFIGWPMALVFLAFALPVAGLIWLGNRLREKLDG